MRRRKQRSQDRPAREPVKCSCCGRMFVQNDLAEWTDIIMRQEPTCSSGCYMKRYGNKELT